jgi:hypothetical protein
LSERVFLFRWDRPNSELSAAIEQRINKTNEEVTIAVNVLPESYSF